MEQLSIQIDNMEDVTKGIDAANRKACTAFIEIGYILRKADDGQLYKEKGYTSIFHFAKHEYGWDKSRTSRFMAVNREYSEGGYSCVLKECYNGYGQAKLEEMLKLPGEIREEITPETKRDDIRQIGKEYKEAEETRQEEQFQESVAPAQQNEEDFFRQAVRTLFEQEEYAKRITNLWPYMLHHKVVETVNAQDLLMALTPSGFGHARAGSFMMFFRKDEIAVLRGRDKETRNWPEFLDTLIDLSPDAHTPEEWYREVYGTELQEEAPPEPERSAANNETSRSGADLQTKKKEHKKQEKTPSKEPKKSPSPTGGIPEKTKPEESTTGAAVETGTNNETPVLDSIRPEGDLISRSAMIKRLEEMCHRCYPEGDIQTTYVTYGDVINEVASMPAVAKETAE